MADSPTVDEIDLDAIEARQSTSALWSAHLDTRDLISALRSVRAERDALRETVERVEKAIAPGATATIYNAHHAVIWHDGWRSACEAVRAALMTPEASR